MYGDMCRHALKYMIPDKARLPLGRAKHRVQKTLQDTWFHFQSGTPSRLIIVVGSSYRVGSTWLYLMLRDVAHCRLGKDHAPTEFLRFSTLVLDPGAYEYLRQLRGRFIFKSHSSPPSSETLASVAKFVSITRDPRDVLVSVSFFMAHLAEEKGGLREGFRDLPISERIQLLLMERSALPILARLEQWYRTPSACMTRYEDLRNQPVEELARIAEFVGVATTKEAIKKIVLKHDFETTGSKRPGKGMQDHRMRKGIVGDWRNHFDRACIDAFKTQMDGRWNHLLVEMGYEDSLDWTR